MLHHIRQRLSVIGQFNILLDNQNISYTVKRSKSARFVRLEIKPATGFTIFAPRSLNLKSIPDLLKLKKSWIIKKLAEYSQVQPVGTLKVISFGDYIPYLGRLLRITRDYISGIDGNIHLKDNNLIINPDGDNFKLEIVLNKWYKQQAEKIIRPKADLCCARLGLQYNRLTIRRSRTRWGSCSRKNNLNFNWKIIMAPEAVIDYIVTHEVIHLKEMNHSPKFWELVAEYCPSWREHKKWLKDYEGILSTFL